jgi:U2 small nuclear ribonucleoprotein A'
MGIKTHTFDTAALANGHGGAKNFRVPWTSEEKAKLRTLIANTNSLQDIIRLEKELNEGRLPAGVASM